MAGVLYIDGWKSLDTAAWLHAGSHADGHLWDMQHSNTGGGFAYAKAPPVTNLPPLPHLLVSPITN
jgi:hypothetical protein